MTYKEGIAMAASILNQINKRDPNSARLESWTEDGTYVSVSVDLDDTELQLRNKIKELQERANNYLRSWSIPPKERKITKPKEPKMAANEMIQYFRGDGNHPIGVMVAIYNDEEKTVSIGWSKCNKKDQFEKEKGLKIARSRTAAGSELAIPSSREFYNEMIEKVKDADTGDIVDVPMFEVIPNLREQYKVFIERVVTYFKSVAPNNFLICGPNNPEAQSEMLTLVIDIRNADIDRQAARKTENA